MKKNSPLLWLIPLIVLLLLVPFVVPSALPYAGAEESSDLPPYEPVELANPHPEPLLPLPSAKEADPTPYVPNPAGYVMDPATGAPTMESPFNPNGSSYAIEGVISPDGLVLGKMGHSERAGKDLYRNIPTEVGESIFRNAVNYFRKR